MKEQLESLVSEMIERRIYLEEALSEFEKKFIQSALTKTRGNQTKAAQGATAGAGVGGIVGGALGLLAGIGALAVPGVGPIIVAGPLMASLAGLGVGGAVGGLVGALVGMGIPEFEAKCYDSRLKDGAVLLAVHCASSDEVCRAREVLEAGGAQDIASCVGECRDPEEGISPAPA